MEETKYVVTIERNTAVLDNGIVVVKKSIEKQRKQADGTFVTVQSFASLKTMQAHTERGKRRLRFRSEKNKGVA